MCGISQELINPFAGKAVLSSGDSAVSRVDVMYGLSVLVIVLLACMHLSFAGRDLGRSAVWAICPVG